MKITKDIKEKARTKTYLLYTQIEIIGKIIFIGHDGFNSGGGVFTYMLRYNGGNIPAKLFYRPFEDKYQTLVPEQPFETGDIVRVVGRLKENKYVNAQFEHVSKGSEIIIEPKGISYAPEYAKALAEILEPDNLLFDKEESLDKKIIDANKFVPKPIKEKT